MATKFDINKSLWQKLMHQAHDKWAGGMSKRDFMKSLSPAEKAACLAGHFNYQTENGGVRQYIDNGYAQGDCGRDLVRLMGDVAREQQCPEAEQLAQKLDVLLIHVNTDAKDRGFNDYWVREERRGGYGWADENDDADEETEGERIAKGMDDWYYARQSVIMPAVERHLETLVARNTEAVPT